MKKSNILIHPKCFICSNCRKIKLKSELKIFQDEKNTYYFCNDCFQSLNNELNKTNQ
jgi:hypothetical protein